jgi:hypothetical protein
MRSISVRKEAFAQALARISIGLLFWGTAIFLQLLPE